MDNVQWFCLVSISNSESPVFASIEFVNYVIKFPRNINRYAPDLNYNYVEDTFLSAIGLSGLTLQNALSMYKY
jgi:hypothetical protein